MSEPQHLQTATKPLASARGLAEERSVRSRLWIAARVPPLGALMGGASVGLVESLYINFQSYGTSDWSGLVYAVLLYGLVGFGCGVALSAAALGFTLLTGAAPDPARSWTVSYLLIS